MLHPHDDYPLHQTPEPLLHVGTDSPNAYDRYFFNGFDRSGERFFAVALGVYPNRRVMDAAFSCIVDGVQHNVRGSRACPADRTDTAAGGVRVEVIEPMRSHRITVDGRHDVRAELTVTAMSPAIEEPRFRHVADGRVVLDYTRLTQFGSWSGWFEVDGERVEVDGFVGVRDRSWGVRPIGEPIAGPPSVPQFFWLWAPTVFDDACTHFALNHESSGRPWHQSGAVTPVIGGDDATIDPGRVQRAHTAEFDVTWQPGTRWAERITTRLGVWNGDPVEISYEPVLRFQMNGIGYRDAVWGHGKWVGPDESTRDRIVLDEVDPLHPDMVHIQAIARARWGEREGIGLVEQFVIGPHEPTGITGILDGAP